MTDVALIQYHVDQYMIMSGFADKLKDKAKEAKDKM
jgi:hypothetical protein